MKIFDYLVPLVIAVVILFGFVYFVATAKNEQDMNSQIQMQQMQIDTVTFERDQWKKLAMENKCQPKKK